MRRVIYFVASSLDGFVARADGGIDWLFSDQDYGYAEFLASIDTVLMGRKTYDVCLTFSEYPYADLKNYVWTRTQPTLAHATSVNEPVGPFISRLREQPGRDIWLVGGGELAGACFAAGVVDELRLFIHPILLGTGLPLAAHLPREVPLKLQSHQSFSSGLVELRYEVKRGS